MQAGRASRPSPHEIKQLLYSFFIDNYLQVRGHILVQFDRDDELANSF